MGKMMSDLGHEPESDGSILPMLDVSEGDVDWDKLNVVEELEARKSLNPLVVENIEHRFVRDLIYKISQHIKVLQCRAMIVADKFAVAEKEVRGCKEDQTSIRTRVRLTKSNTIEISWNRIQSFRVSDQAALGKGKVIERVVEGKKARYLLKTDYLKKGKGDRYSTALFKKDPMWVKEIVDELEDKNALLRRQSEILSEIRRLLYRFDRITTEYYDDIVHREMSRYRLLPMNFSTTSSQSSDHSAE